MKALLPKVLGNYINALAVISPQAAAALAFHIFSKPRQGAVGPHHQEFLDGARVEVFGLDELKIQVYHWPASGPTVLLVHGWESHSHRWKMLIEKLQTANFNIFSIDAPAHGYSSGTNFYVPLYEQVVNLMVDKYTVDYIVGHSVGGMTALYHQYKNPSQTVKKLVILGSPDRLEDIMTGFQSVLGLSGRAMTSLNNYFKDRFGFRIEEFNGAAFAKGLQVPGLVIHDKDDKITPFKGSVAIAKAWGKAEFMSTNGLGHSLYSEEVNNRILQFLSEK